MPSLGQRPICWPAILPFSGAILLAAGCASPGSPRPPSLQLPQVVSDLSAVRSGDAVQLRFTVPSRTTDGQRLRQPTLHGTLCRQDAPNAACTPVDTAQTAAPLPVPADGSSRKQVLWTDTLLSGLAAGPPRVILYRVELRNEQGRSAGPSSPAYAAAGTAPVPVEQFRAQGARPGVLLQWSPAQEGKSEILLARQQIEPSPDTTLASAPAPTAQVPAVLAVHSRSRRHVSEVRSPHSSQLGDSGLTWLQAEPGKTDRNEMLDGTAEEGVRYRYTAVRREVVRIGGRTLELRSATSVPVEIAWRDVYPPAAPQDLTAIGYSTGQGSGTERSSGTPGYAVDLIWQPVRDSRLTGYVVTRADLSAPDLAPERLTATPVTTPAFHDITAAPSKSYRYEVTAVDAKGNVSPAAIATVQAITK